MKVKYTKIDIRFEVVVKGLEYKARQELRNVYTKLYENLFADQPVSVGFSENYEKGILYVTVFDREH